MLLETVNADAVVAEGGGKAIRFYGEVTCVIRE
jgi:hypothetical protein